MEYVIPVTLFPQHTWNVNKPVYSSWRHNVRSDCNKSYKTAKLQSYKPT